MASSSSDITTKQELYDLFEDTRKRFTVDLEDGDFESEQARQALLQELLVQMLKCNALAEKLSVISSKNESINEIASLDLKFLLIQYYLGLMFSKMQPNQQNDMKTANEIRKKNLLQAKAQLGIFIDRCDQLELLESRDAKLWMRMSQQSDGDEDGAGPSASSSSAGNSDPYARRNEKIERLKRKNALQKDVEQLYEQRTLLMDKLGLKSLEDMESCSEYDEIERNYSIALIKFSIIDSLENLDSLQNETNLLDAFLKQAALQPQIPLRGAGARPGAPQQGPQQARKPQVVVTNIDALEKQGGLRFNQGGKSNGAPVMVKLTPAGVMSASAASGSWDKAAFRQQKLQEMFSERNPATISIEQAADQEMHEMHERAKRQAEAEKAKKVEDEDLDRDEHVDAKTYKDRNWDDWKDDNPRGVGRLQDYGAPSKSRK